MNNKKSQLIHSKQLKLEQGLKPRKSTRKTPKKIKLDELGQPKEPTVHHLKPFEKVIDKTTFYQHLDSNLIVNILKLKEQLNPIYKDFTLVNSHVSNSATSNVITNYNNFYKAIKAYYKNPALFTGQPKLPTYHSKNNRCAFSLDKYKFIAKDQIAARIITQDNINDFTSIKDKNNINQLFLDTAKLIPVSKEDINTYNKFNLMPFINHKLNQVLKNEKEQLVALETIYNHKFHQSKNKIENSFKSELNLEFVELKVIPLKHKNKLGHTVRLEVVLKHTLNLPENSMLYKLLLIHPKFLELADKDKITVVQNYSKNQFKINNKSLNNINLNSKNKLKISSIDLGNRNLCSMSYNDGSEGLIVTGNNYFKTVNKVDLKIDKRKSELNNSTIKSIQSAHDKLKNTYKELRLQYTEELKLISTNINLNSKEFNLLLKEKLEENNIKFPELSKQDKALVEEYEKHCREDKYLVKQQTYKNNYMDDFVHKLSTKIITNCLNKDIDYLVVGKNDNWKQNINIGKTNNRASYNFPHTELVEQLKYKALKFGLVVLVTEESYTSKTSFINNVELKIYNKKEVLITEDNIIAVHEIKNNEKISNKPLNKGKNKNELKEEISKKIEIKSCEKNPRNKPLLPLISNIKKVKENTYGGYRKTRDSYINITKNSLNINKNTKNKGMNNNLKKELKINNGKKKVNADMNGSFNIMRKVFLHIEYNETDYNFNYRLVSMNGNNKKFKSIVKKRLKLN